MAACRNPKCGKAVGCGCNLNKNGLCATCAKAEREGTLTLTPPIPPTIFVPIDKAKK